MTGATTLCVVCSFPFINSGRNGQKETYCSRCYFLLRNLSGRDLNREKVRILDNHTCRSCFKKWEPGMRRFDIHHTKGLCGKKSRGYDKTSKRPFTKVNRSGLLTLCHRCHLANHVSTGRHSKRYAVSTEELRSAMKAPKATYDSVGARFGMSQTAVYRRLKRK